MTVVCRSFGSLRPRAGRAASFAPAARKFALVGGRLRTELTRSDHGLSAQAAVNAGSGMALSVGGCSLQSKTRMPTPSID